MLSDFVGNMGFDEVTDWEYYYQNEEDENDRKVVEPNPFDSATPKRTRQSSGSVVRVLLPIEEVTLNVLVIFHCVNTHRQILSLFLALDSYFPG